MIPGGGSCTRSKPAHLALHFYLLPFTFFLDKGDYSFHSWSPGEGPAPAQNLRISLHSMLVFYFHSSLWKLALLVFSGVLEIKNPMRWKRIGFWAGAEEEGFEPPVPWGTTVFKTAAFDHSAIPPGAKLVIFYYAEVNIEKKCSSVR